MSNFVTFHTCYELKCGFKPPGGEILQKFIKKTQVIFSIVKFSVLSYTVEVQNWVHVGNFDFDPNFELNRLSNAITTRPTVRATYLVKYSYCTYWSVEYTVQCTHTVFRIFFTYCF